MRYQDKNDENVPRGGGDVSGKSAEEEPRGGGDVSGKQAQSTNTTINSDTEPQPRTLTEKS